MKFLFTSTRKTLAFCGAFAALVVLSGCVTPQPKLAPTTGIYKCPQTVTITDQQANAAIYYTTDGSTPTTASTKYAGPFVVSNTDTVQAIALAPGSKVSTPATVSYTCAPSGLTHADFATAVSQHFNLPAPSNPVKFGDIHPQDSFYNAAQAMYPFMHPILLCPGCLLTSNFSPNNPITRAQSAVLFVSILTSQQKVQLMNVAQATSYLAEVPDAGTVPALARPYIAAAIQNGILKLQDRNTFQPMQPFSSSDMTAAFATIQTQFNLPAAQIQ